MNVISHIALFLLSMSIMIGQSSLKQVKSGTMYEFIGKKKNVKIKIDAFLMSDHAVTNGEFRNFIRQNPQWKKSRVSRLLADRNYLQHWTSDSTFPAHMEHATITNVSWHSAKAYCAWKGGMLPTNAQWEFALSKNHISIQTGKKISINEVLLKWYANGNSDIFKHGIISSDGIRDLVGSHWEWTEDFNELMVNGDSRGGGNEQLVVARRVFSGLVADKDVARTRVGRTRFEAQSRILIPGRHGRKRTCAYCGIGAGAREQ